MSHIHLYEGQNRMVAERHQPFGVWAVFGQSQMKDRLMGTCYSNKSKQKLRSRHQRIHFLITVLSFCFGDETLLFLPLPNSATSSLQCQMKAKSLLFSQSHMLLLSYFLSFFFFSLHTLDKLSSLFPTQCSTYLPHHLIGPFQRVFGISRQSQVSS